MKVTAPRNLTKSMNLTGQFLVAMPSLSDSPFSRGLVYLCEHNQDGAMGILVNTPVDLTVANMLSQINVAPAYPLISSPGLDHYVFQGGPIAKTRGFILHTPKDKYQSSISVTNEVSLTTSKDILSVLGTQAEPDNYLIALGYSGWDSGQLETELADNYWLTVQADPNLIFSTPVHERWQLALAQLGIHESQLSYQAGHA